MQILIRHWWQRWRMPELRLLFWALLVSVTVVTAVGFFTSRVENAMQAQAQQLLGGDLVLTSSRPLAAANLQRAAALGLTSAQTINFPSMAVVGEKLQLSELKVVSAQYPLQGELKTTAQLGAVEEVMQQLPQRGEIWAEARLFTALGVDVGAEIQLGQSRFTLARVLTHEPDRSNNPFQLAPVILLNLADLDATGLLSPASRARFNQLFVGDSTVIEDLRTELAANLKPTERIRSIEEDLSSVQQALQRAGRFLGLAALLTVVLAGTAVALTASSLMRRELATVAVLKAMGQSRRRILLDYSFSLLLTALLAAFLGGLIGVLLQLGLSTWLSHFVGHDLPAPSSLPLLSGLLTAIALLLGFALPQLLRLVDTSPMQILQGSLQRPHQAVWVMWVCLLGAVFGLFWLQAQDLQLAAIALGAVLMGLLVFWLAARGFLSLLQHVAKRRQWHWLPALGRSPRAVLLVMVFASGFFVLLLLTVVRTDLLNQWQETLPIDAPDHFMINIQPAEAEPLRQFLQAQGVQAELYPMIRGRLVEINDQAVNLEDYSNPRAQRLLAREFNLSSLAELPSSNTLLAGEWFTPQSQGFSVEQEIGELLGFGMGDTLTFDIAGQRFSRQISSVREVEWGSMQPNFFVIAEPNGLRTMPQTFITSVHLGDKKAALSQLLQQFPSVTAIDIGAIVQQVRRLVNEASLAVQGIFVFTLVAGVVVLLAALQSQKPERQREIAILKALGARQRLLQQRIWSEFVLLGALAGLLAGILASISGGLFGYFVFDFAFQLGLFPLVLGMLCGGILVGVAGYWNLRPLLQTLPMSLLKS